MTNILEYIHNHPQ